MTASERREELAFDMGAMFVRALQGDYSLVNFYAKEFKIDFKDGKPFCPKFDFSSSERSLLEKVREILLNRERAWEFRIMEALRIIDERMGK